MSNHIKQSGILEHFQVPKEAQDKLSSLLQTKNDSIVPKFSTDMGRTNLFQMDIPTTGAPPLLTNSNQFH